MASVISNRSLYIETLANEMQKRADYLCANETMTRCHPKMTPLESNSGVHHYMDPKLGLNDTGLHPYLGDYIVLVCRIVFENLMKKKSYFIAKFVAFGNALFMMGIKCLITIT